MKRRWTWRFDLPGEMVRDMAKKTTKKTKVKAQVNAKAKAPLLRSGLKRSVPASEGFEKEEALFEPVKMWLEREGFRVQGEIGDVDVYGCRDVISSRDAEGGQCLSVAVELKLKPSLELLIQGADRLSDADIVYIAFPRHQRARDIKKICTLLGIGILLIDSSSAVYEFLPPIKAKKLLNSHAKRELVEEFHKRKIRNAVGGINGKVLTSYREQALSIAFLLLREETISLKALREKGIAKPENFLYPNYYHWFEKAEKRGYYRLSDFGKSDLQNYHPYRETLDCL
ncbi:MAG: DUF2161 family putative PD-(D/E)XK-type phosphodiesterase [Bacillota bacterium]|nr:DUF2161 family putative PD-(D/E)XK-type phosphodiesterase [Bacillota bacterium]